MKVAQLIQLLEDMDPDAEVYFASQPSYPFEMAITDVTTRGEVEGFEPAPSDDEYSNEPVTYHRNLRWGEPEAAAEDVILVEGLQVRYGSQKYWESAR